MQDIVYYRERLNELLEEARADGVVIRVDLAPRAPLTMGSYDMVSEVRLHQQGKNFGDKFPYSPPWPVVRNTKKGKK